jgi:hypothetical protein
VIRARSAHARLSLLSLLLASALVPSQSRAEFRGKGSVVGRILSESVAEAESLKDESSDDAESEPPISKEALNALMKHPTEPDYDPLRPMSGRWVRCQSVVSQSAPPPTEACTKPGCKPIGETTVVKSRQDRYSSSDHSHFTHTVSMASDSDCKTVVTQDRTTYECRAAEKKRLSCSVAKREARIGLAGAWIPEKSATDERPIQLSFPGIEKKKKSKRARKAHDPRTLELRIDDQPIELEFEPTPPNAASPRGHKTND